MPSAVSTPAAASHGPVFFQRTELAVVPLARTGGARIGPGGRTRGGASGPAVGSTASSRRCHRACAFFTATTPRGAQIWIRCGSSRGQPSGRLVYWIGGWGLLELTNDCCRLLSILLTFLQWFFAILFPFFVGSPRSFFLCMCVCGVELSSQYSLEHLSWTQSLNYYLNTHLHKKKSMYVSF